MIELLSLYLWPLLSALMLAAALSLTGTQLVAREWSVRSLVVAQSSTVGVLFGIALTFLFEPHPLWSFVIVTSAGTIFSLLIAILLGIEHFGLKRPQTLLTVFVVLSAIAAIFTALIPKLEANMSAVYAGDITTLSNLEARLHLAFGLGITAYLWKNWSQLSQSAFRNIVLGTPESSFVIKAFTLSTMLLVVLGVQGLGLSFVLACLFLPTSLTAGTDRSLRQHQIHVVLIASIGTFLGFLVSLADTRLPTTAVIVLAQLVIGYGIRLISTWTRS
ncbi:MAG: metal ABC transporter permease [Bdellovibrionales bacterium]|nr:metal ABC transporter permease [Bdellovibrionales bacterium]